jgi:hypothetical protein
MGGNLFDLNFGSSFPGKTLKIEPMNKTENLYYIKMINGFAL